MRHQQLYLTNVFGTLSKDDQISGRGRQLIKTLCTRRPNCSVSSLEILTVISTHALEKPPRFLEPGEPSCLCRLCWVRSLDWKLIKTHQDPHCPYSMWQASFFRMGIYGKNRLFQAEGQKWVLRSQLLMSKNKGERKTANLSLTGSTGCFC